MSLIDEIGQLGANIGDAMRRFMDNTALYERMLKTLPEVAQRFPVKPYFDSEDYETAINNAHTLKGVVGNLSLDTLYIGYSGIVSLLRDGKIAEARATMEKTLEDERRIIECIRKYSE